MKTAAIIAEYNPFHNGHKYQIEETRRRTGADFIAVVMSGDFVQRGAPAIYSKFLRTRSALLSGADLVVEMPVFGSLSAAQDFARCGISLFHHMGIIDVLSFGSEAGEIKKLQELADQVHLSREVCCRMDIILGFCVRNHSGIDLHDTDIDFSDLLFFKKEQPL